MLMLQKAYINVIVNHIYKILLYKLYGNIVIENVIENIY